MKWLWHRHRWSPWGRVAEPKGHGMGMVNWPPMQARNCLDRQCNYEQRRSL